MEATNTVSTKQQADVDQRGWRKLNQALDQIAELTKPASRWPKQLLAQAERKAAKGLWTAAAQLGRAAHKLDAAGRALESRSNGKITVNPPSSAGNDSENLMGDDEFFSPHLA